jgi:hypothetical protein
MLRTSQRPKPWLRHVLPVASILVLTACAAQPALCGAVEEVAASHDTMARELRDDVDAAIVAVRYDDLAATYEVVADMLDGRSARESTHELASLFARGAELAEEHEETSAREFEQILTESDVHQRLRERMAGPHPMGFSEDAWTEIEADCDIPVDPEVEDLGS